MSKLFLLVTAIFVITGCQSTYYKTMEVFGYEKRDIMVDKVQETRDAQEQAQKQFVSALDQLTELTNYKGSDLEKQYNKLKDQYQKSQSKAAAVSGKIAQVEQVSKDLFKEWNQEIKQYTNENLKQSSIESLNKTQEKYEGLIVAMKRAESKIPPVLNALKDQVLFLKHNLNAQAVASLQSELTTIENDVEMLIKEMQAAISEADAFIAQMQ
jgi:hypothetical protein